MPLSCERIENRNGNIRARHVKRCQPATVEHYQGVVCSLKDNYGFIERADIVKEIFFHYSEFQGDIQKLSLGDDVEFSIQTRNVGFLFLSLFIITCNVGNF